MRHLQNLHTHTSYCDGADTPEEIVLAAIDKGFESIGFSGHSYMSYSRMFLEKGDKTEEYKENVKSLKEKYKDRIKIYLGLEVEEREIYATELPEMAECGLCGTAAVISPVGKIVDHGCDINFNIGESGMGDTIKKLYDTLTGIQMGTVTPPEGWVKVIK